MKKLLFIFILIFAILLCSCNKNDLNDQNYFYKITYEVDTNDGFQFAFHYKDDNEPNFKLISPSSKIYTKDSEDIQIERVITENPNMFNSIYFLFEKGEKGKWEIYFDKSLNDEVKINYRYY